MNYREGVYIFFTGKHAKENNIWSVLTMDVEMDRNSF